MPKTISATEARVRFGEVLRRVSEEGVTYIVERAGKPQAVVVSSEEYQRLTERQPGESYVEAIKAVRDELGPLAEEKAQFNWENLIREERETRAQQIDDAVRGR